MTKITEWANATGEFNRQISSFRKWIKKGTEFEPESNRYHLIVSKACPWACRTLAVRAIKKLEDVISMSVVHYHMEEKGWRFATHENEADGVDVDSKRPYLRDYYFASEPDYSGRFTVPVLYDKKTDKIVNNESSEIIRILNSEFNAFSGAPDINLYPDALKTQIDQLNEWVYDKINNGVYKTGFATKQDVYEKHCRSVFEGLDKVEAILSKNQFLCGDYVTEADIRLFVTIVRFDPVYVGHFKCNLKTIEFGYPKILNWTRRLYQYEGMSDTVNMFHIKHHYYMSQTQINPNKVVALSNGPDLSVKVDPVTSKHFQ